MKHLRLFCAVLLSVALVLTATACKKVTGPVPSEGPGTSPGGDLFEYEEKYIEIPSLKEVFKDYFTVGVGLEPNALIRYGDKIPYHFDSLTPGNSMKPDATQPTQGNFQFGRGDQIVDFAQEYDMEVHGHTLVWHSQTPAWFFQENGQFVSRETAIERMRNHIYTVVGKYKGIVKEWDVVNEPIADDGSGLRNSPWYQAIGKDYIKLAFQFAHEADPDAKLVLNDYNIEVPGKREAFINLVKELLAEGVPIHAIGIQGHWQLGWPSADSIRQSLEMYSELGLEIQITELDISVYAWGDNSMLPGMTLDLLKRQADRYQTLFNIFKDFDQIKKVTTWGFADDDTWLDNHPVRGRKDWPMMFDIDQKPKEAFWRVVEEPVLSSLEADKGVWLKPFECGLLTHLLRVDEGTEQVRIKPVANDLKVKMTVEGAEKDGQCYVIDVKQQAPQARIIVTGYGKTNTYEIYVQENKKETIGKWEFNEGEGTHTKDESGYTKDAYVGDVEWVDGIEGKAIRFKGEGESVDLGLGSLNMFGSNAFSVSLWIKPEILSRNTRLLWYGNSVANNSILWRVSTLIDGGVQFHVQQPLTKEKKGSQFVSTDTGLIEANEWNHILCVRDNDTLTIYVNGEKSASESFGYTVDLSGFTLPLAAGADKDKRGDRYVGAMDSVRIYNYALSEDAVKEIYKAKGK